MAKHDYMNCVRKIYKALVKDWDEADCNAVAEAEWIKDADANGQMSRDFFFDAMFELADTYTRSVSEANDSFAAPTLMLTLTLTLTSHLSPLTSHPHAKPSPTPRVPNPNQRASTMSFSASSCREWRDRRRMVTTCGRTTLRSSTYRGMATTCLHHPHPVRRRSACPYGHGVLFRPRPLSRRARSQTL